MSNSSRGTGWQQRLLPMMSAMLVGLTLFFFVITLVQLLYLQSEIRRESPVTLSDAVLKAALPEQGSPGDRLAAVRLRAAAELEVQVVARRYRQATVLLMSRVWTHYLGFVTGMILALVGSAFILGKLQGPASDLAMTSTAANWSIKSSSPGIILAALGTALILATVLTNHRIDVTDSPLYLRDVPVTEPPASAPPPRLDNPFAPPKS
jgi:hypothetical protein